MKAIETKFIKKNLRVGKIIKVYTPDFKDFHFDIILSFKPFIVFCMYQKETLKLKKPEDLYRISECRIIEYENTQTQI